MEQWAQTRNSTAPFIDRPNLMKFTLNWLKDFVAYAGTPERLAELLTMAGLEVESLAAVREPDTDRPDWIFEISVTPNRSDCLGIVGIAREVAVLSKAELRAWPSSTPDNNSEIKKRIRIRIEDAQLCSRYSARVVDDLRIAPSPSWLRYRLEACGIRAINNVVDVTNYVMLETGQPLHAFDLDRLRAKEIVVRAAGQMQKFTTLDSIERELHADDLVVCDGDRPIALAGVMGGSDSEVCDDTRSVLLESANFSTSAVRRTAKRLSLHSEASHRFERGVDPEETITALNRAVHLLGQIAAGQAVIGVLDLYPRKVKAPTILLRQDRIENLLGLKVDLEEVEKILQALAMSTRLQKKNHSLEVMPPTSRPDISREADLIEEIARVQGYGNIPTTMPSLRSAGAKTDLQLGWERKLRAYFAGEGFFEIINLPFTTDSLNDTFSGLWQDRPRGVVVLNPLAKDYASMRHSLLPGLIDNLRLNLAHKAKSCSLYHLGKVFRLASDDASEERQVVSAILYGPRARLGLFQGQEK
ncbi:MAG TPA: phenylalanine--tRNA ligase subunit beta, partial [Terriglobales bacterium]|nr:phenylalanine--tRNA ligase subunit beta [Terriglobales bacterium]